MSGLFVEYKINCVCVSVFLWFRTPNINCRFENVSRVLLRRNETNPRTVLAYKFSAFNDKMFTTQRKMKTAWMINKKCSKMCVCLKHIQLINASKLLCSWFVLFATCRVCEIQYIYHATRNSLPCLRTCSLISLEITEKEKQSKDKNTTRKFSKFWPVQSSTTYDKLKSMLGVTIFHFACIVNIFIVKLGIINCIYENS